MEGSRVRGCEEGGGTRMSKLEKRGCEGVGDR